jgi:hypothetical protein
LVSWAQAREWQLMALHGLGDTLFCGLAQAEAAEARYRQALTLARSIGRPARELAPLYYLLGETFWVRYRPEEMLAVAEEGLALPEVLESTARLFCGGLRFVLIP